MSNSERKILKYYGMAKPWHLLLSLFSCIKWEQVRRLLNTWRFDEPLEFGWLDAL